MIKILSVHAHFDDYEFVASGLFEIWKRRLDDRLRARVMVCTDGQAGHHFRTRQDTGRIRIAEQEESARLGRYELEILRLPNGEIPREACLQVTTDLLAALWKSIRTFEPRYIFCPPLAADPLAGIHVDHVAVADAVRKVAYMINVPHAFTPEYPAADETQSAQTHVPVILNVHDAYMAGENSFDLAIDVEEAFLKICEMSWCHRSQIQEWIPWVGRHDLAAARSFEEWMKILRRRFLARNREMGIRSDRVYETFTVTAWGRVPGLDELLADFPGLDRAASNLERFEERLKRWGG